MGDVRWPTSRSNVTQCGHVMLLLAISFLSCLVNGQSSLQPSGRAIPNYKIVPKPCKVKALEGTCMFVWECLKTDGKAVGMCVDGFMFGSCCVHNAENNLLDATSVRNVTYKPASVAGEEILSIVTSEVAVSNKPTEALPTTSVSTVKTSSSATSTTIESRPTSVTTQSSGPVSTTHYKPTSSITPLVSVTPSYIPVSAVTSDYKPVSTVTSDYKTSSTVTSDYKPASVVPSTVSSVTSNFKPVSEVTSNYKPVSEKPVLVSSAVSLIGSKPAVVLKPDEKGSGSAIIQSNGVLSQAVSGVKTVPAPVETSALIGSLLSITSGKPTISVSSAEYFPDGIIIQKVTKPTRPNPSSKPTTPPTTTKLETISLSSSGEPVRTSTTQSIPTSTTQIREKTPSPTPGILLGVEVETTVLAHESHSIDAQHFLTGSTPTIGQKTSEEPPTFAPGTAPTEYTEATDFVTNPDGVTQNPMEFPEYLLEVTGAPNGFNRRCGTPNPMPKQPTTRVVGGSNSIYGAWPWQASVRRTSFFGFSSTHRCGGTLLNEHWVITAAHCVEDLLLTQIRVRLGEYDVASLTEPYPVVERSITKKIVHPKYNFFTYEYDIALLRLEEPVEFSPTISPICLPSSDDLLVGMNATVTGWGRLSEGGTLPNVLQQVTLPIISNDKCKNMFLKSGRHEFIPEIFLCTGYEEGGRDACQGDSGGPLQMKARDGRYFLAGIISWGIGCAEPNLPGVCTRISKFTNWILENIAS